MNKFPFFLFLIFISYSCHTEHFEIENLNDNKIMVLGHGGMGSGLTHPTNTLESISECLSLGADGTEIDVQLSKDGVLIAFHDRDLKDNTNLEGIINDYNWSEIKDAKYTNIPFLEYSVVSLDELYKNLISPNKFTFSFDLKLYNGSEEAQLYLTRFANALIHFIEKNNLEENVFIESQHIPFLSQLKELNPSIRLLYYPYEFEFGLQKAIEMNLHGISISMDNISKEQIKKAHDNSIHVALWSVNSRRKNQEAIRMNPDIIQTDRLENLLDLLKE